MEFKKNLALIGAGYWGKNLARNFHSLGALHTLCDRDQSILNSYGPDYATVSKNISFEEILANEEIETVAIAAPAALHYRLAKSAIQHGKDVFVEKPLCLDIAEAEELVRLAKGSGRVLMVGHLLQYHPCVIEIQRLITEGSLGKLQYITSNRLNLGKFRKEENTLWSFAPHDISIILSLVNGQLPQQITCTGESYLTAGVADTTLTSLKFNDSVRAHVYVSWLNPFKEQKLTVVGSHGMIVFDDTKPWAEKLQIHRNYLTWTAGQNPTPNKIDSEFLLVPELEPLREECAHFLECCRDRSTPRSDGAEGLRVLRVLKAANTSLESDGGVTFPLEANITHTFFAHPSAIIDPRASVGSGSKIWHFSHVMGGAELGEKCNLGQNVVISPGVKLGRNVKVQNNVSIYSGTTVEDDVFLGPSCVLTNVTNPRSQINRQSLYESTLIRRGATLGANCTIVCGITIGRYAFIAAGSIVTKDVPDYALVIGNPARQQGWMSRHGHRLTPDDTGIMVCPESGLHYQETSPGLLRCLDLNEDDALPLELALGRGSYEEFKSV